MLTYVRAARQQLGEHELIECRGEVVCETLRLVELVDEIIGGDDPAQPQCGREVFETVPS